MKSNPEIVESLSDSSPPATDRSHRDELLTRLFHDHNRELIGFLCTRLRSEQDAKEVAQEAYARLLGLDQPGAISLLRAYLFKTAAHLAIDRLRHQSTHRQLQPKLCLLDEQAEDATPEQQAAREQEAALVNQYLRELPPRHREAFLLYRVHDYRIEEVAKHLGVTDRMIRNYVVKAMAYCRARLDGLDSDQAAASS